MQRKQARRRPQLLAHFPTPDSRKGLSHLCRPQPQNSADRSCAAMTNVCTQTPRATWPPLTAPLRAFSATLPENQRSPDQSGLVQCCRTDINFVCKNYLELYLKFTTKFISILLWGSSR